MLDLGHSTGETYTWSGSSKEDECPEVCSTLVAQGTGGINQGCNTVGLDGATSERASPSCGSTCGLLGLEEFFLGVGSLGAVVCITKDWGQNSQGGSVGKDGAQGDSGGLDRGEI